MTERRDGRAPWAVMTIDAPGEAEEELVRLLCQRGALGVQTATGPEGSLPAGRAILLAYFDAGAALPAASDLERLCPPARGMRVLSTRAVADGRWVEKWIAALDPFDVGRRFRVIPVAEARAGAPPPDGEDLLPKDPRRRIPLRIVPGRAFGTGEHATTRLCLEALEGLPGIRGGGKSLLDVGTGSGILALAGLALGFRPVLGIDVDPEAVGVARANVALNPWAGSLELKVGEVSDVEGRFHAVVANLNRGILEECLTGLVRAVEPGGVLVLGGLLEVEAAVLAEQASARGAESPAIRTLEGWACLVLEVAGA